MPAWFPDPVEIPLATVLGIIDRLDAVVVDLEAIGETHLAFAVHREVHRLLDYVIPDEQ